MQMDKASILGDTIEYVKQLRRRIHELESRNKLIESDRKSKATEVSKFPGNSLKDRTITQTNCASIQGSRNRVDIPETRKLRVVEYRKATASKPATKMVEALSSSVHVSISEADALIELQCPYREGLLLQIMRTLDELQLEITFIHSSSADGIFSAELRAKVGEISISLNLRR